MIAIGIATAPMTVPTIAPTIAPIMDSIIIPMIPKIKSISLIALPPFQKLFPILSLHLLIYIDSQNIIEIFISKSVTKK